jgi:hypothetical protein
MSFRLFVGLGELLYFVRTKSIPEYEWADALFYLPTTQAHAHQQRELVGLLQEAEKEGRVAYDPNPSYAGLNRLLEIHKLPTIKSTFLYTYMGVADEIKKMDIGFEVPLGG